MFKLSWDEGCKAVGWGIISLVTGFGIVELFILYYR